MKKADSIRRVIILLVFFHQFYSPPVSSSRNTSAISELFQYPCSATILPSSNLAVTCTGSSNFCPLAFNTAEDEVIANAGAYDKDLSLFKPWTSRTMAP